MEPVRCADCGYLAARLKQERQLVEAEEGLRESWFVVGRTLPEGHYAWHPVCFVMAANLAEEIRVAEDADPEKTMGGKCTEVISSPRQCASFCRWRQGHSPREHQEMQFAEEQRARDLAWQEKQAAEARHWQESQTAENRRWQLKLAAIAAIFTLLNGLVMWLLGKGH